MLVLLRVKDTVGFAHDSGVMVQSKALDAETLTKVECGSSAGISDLCCSFIRQGVPLSEARRACRPDSLSIFHLYICSRSGDEYSNFKVH